MKEFSFMVNAEVIASGWYVPSKVLNNEFFIRSPNNPYRVYIGEDEHRRPLFKKERTELTEEKILANTGGIKERRAVSDGEGVVDMVEKAFNKTGFNAEDLDGIIIGTISDETRFPSVACRVQERIGARRVISYSGDSGSACSGFTHALDHARLKIQEEGGCYLVAGIETLTRITDYTEINCDLFGDGCGLVVLGPASDGDKRILTTAFSSDTSGINYIYKDSEGLLRMPRGADVLKKATRGMIEIAHKMMAKSGINKEQVDIYIPHQANGRIIDEIEKRVDPQQTGKIYRNIDKYGNMSAATIPVAFAEAVKEGRIQKGNLVAMVDMGAGLAFGGALIRV